MKEQTFAPAESVGDLINDVAYRMRQNLAQRLGLDITIWPILYCLWEKDGVAQAHIGETTRLPGYAISRGVDRLESVGLVERRHDPDNRRVRLVFLTEAGRRSRDELLPMSAEINARILNVLSAAEQQQLFGILRKLLQVL